MIDISPELARFLRIGWKIFPVYGFHDGICTCEHGAKCESPGKHPRTPNGFNDASGNHDQIQNWIDRFGRTNWGAVTGKKNGIFAVDVDPRHGGDKTLAALENEYGKLPETRLHRTGGGGLHYVYTVPRGVVIPTGNNLLGDGIDVKGEGGYIIIPPSRGIDGTPYEPLNDLPSNDAPQWMIDKILAAVKIQKKDTPAARGPTSPGFKSPETIKSGARNTTLFSLARSLAMKGLGETAIFSALAAENAAKCTPPVSESEIKSIVNSAISYDRGDLAVQPTRTETVSHARREHPRLTIDLEPDNFVVMYSRYAGLNQAPYPDYHFASSITLLSLAADRKCYIQTAAKPVYPNIWAMLLGESTISHKSDAIEYPLQHSRVAFPEKEIPGHWSAAGLFQELADKPRGYLIKDECASILSNINNNKEAGAARDLLMMAYDSPDRITKTLTKKKGSEQYSWTIENAYVTFLWATTPDNFAKNTTALDVNSGWLLRFLFFHPNYKKQPVPFSFKNGKANQLAAAAYARYKKIREVIDARGSFEFTMSPEGEKYFQDWQVSKELEIQESDRSTEGKVFGRLLVAALKLSMLFTLGSAAFVSAQPRPGGEVQIPLAYVKEAIRQVDEYFIPMARAVIETVERNETANVQDKIRGKLETDGGETGRSELMRYVRVKKNDFDEHIKTMLESGEIVEILKTRTGVNDQNYQTVVYQLA